MTYVNVDTIIVYTNIEIKYPGCKLKYEKPTHHYLHFIA